MATSRKPPRTLYQPRVGEVVRDLAHKGAEGVYMGTVAGRVYLRPPGGGVEWETYPSEIEPLGNAPERERVADGAA
ncbi:hypothetical protein AB0D10_31510 [Kitasatospora sp. NPDC048545]|uniref:hypothetical protein n=1 Tax=Kitasatospora sp. NPDC048545 TaxID=3157208 RepID=UPI0033E0B244